MHMLLARSCDVGEIYFMAEGYTVDFGSIFRELTRLALPVVGASFLQLAYNMVDIFWVGRLGGAAVAAVGSAGFFVHLGWAVCSLVLIGTGVRIAQNVGRGDLLQARRYSGNGLLASQLLAVLYMGLLLGAAPWLISLFNLHDAFIENMSADYLRITALGLPITYAGYMLASVFNSYGRTAVPMKVNMLGLGLNILLDPLFIFTFGWGVAGAAIATILAQGVSLGLFFYYLRKCGDMHFQFKLLPAMLLDAAKLGLPVTAQRVLFSLIGIAMAGIIARWGGAAIAAQKVGLQIEALSFMTLSALHQAMTTYCGQRYGAGDLLRLRLGYKVGAGIGCVVGLVATLIFWLGAEPLVRLFLDEGPAVGMGVAYLRIVGLSQLFLSLELVSGGALNGVGKTHFPAGVCGTLTVLRVPLALWLSSTALGLDGVWWSISLTTVLKGSLLIVIFSWLAGANGQRLNLAPKKP